MQPTPIDDLLAKPIIWKNWSVDSNVRKVLSGLQANILKGHGREHTRNLFWNLQGADTDALRTVVRRLGRAMPSALDQLQAAEQFKRTGESGGPVICLFLRPGGYAALGAADLSPSAADHVAYAAGMPARGSDATLDPPINDPGVDQWDEGYQGDIDAMLLVAGTTAEEADLVAQRWRQRFASAGAELLHDEAGRAIKRKVAGRFEGVEHFGYVDGRSQPLFLAEDVAGESGAHWDPAFPPSQFLVPDPGDDQPTSFGSFFVYRKLEQDVAGFKDQEDSLAASLGLTGGPFEERAGALLVGRFEDGSPVVLDPLPTDMPPVNDFDYRSDEEGSRCPFAAHIRKVNPRGESPLHIAQAFNVATTVRQERGHIMARRGITYGARTFDEDANDFTDVPTGGVGLLFMAYMASVERQFEFTQASWANNPAFVAAGTGVDPVIGQGPRVPVDVPDGWSGASAALTFGDFVTLKGGQYFFAPSRDFLKAV
jgi:Dyp-type peroxidase family